MKSARILFNNETLAVTVNEQDQVVTQQGKTLEEGSFTWLPPCEGKMFVLAINYADHAAELSFAAPEEPLVFLKSKNSLIGHDQKTYRPDNIDYMHYEC
jgi:5-oxopent-3-ene-1,2,5-tricarboxylate decarboxylase/2-hydroxyhepta-2,4-diene-1,7-dioate isomerase